MNPPQLAADFTGRNVPILYGACATAALLLVVAAVVLLATLDVALWEMKVLGRTLAQGKVQASVKRVDRSAGAVRYSSHSGRWRT